MIEIKKQFKFIHSASSVVVNVRLCGAVYCAIFNVKNKEIAKPLIIGIDGAIYLRENAKLLGFINIKDIRK